MLDLPICQYNYPADPYVT
uniref:Uncharacterized protein n=1 Tax=Anguilla anguilla TaxID=7936 RepID=A0A0E9SSQ3_ANGAN